MVVKETKLKGCFVIEPRLFEDGRGYFFESFNNKKFKELIQQDVNFVQDNQSFSKRGTLRGLHYQVGRYAQAKLVRVISGSVLDVAVDLRKESPTFKQHIAIELSAENKKQLFIPRGFAHGFVVLSDTAEFFYKCDNFYNQKAEEGIIFSDSELGINWNILREDLVISEKDLALPKFADARI